MFSRFIKILWGVSLVLLACMGMIVLVDIAFRYILRHSLPWGVEVCEYILFFITYLAAPWLLLEGKHVKIEVIDAIIPPRAKVKLSYFQNITGIIFCFSVAIANAIAAWRCYKVGLKVTRIYSVDKFYFMLLLSFCFVLLAIGFGYILLYKRKSNME